VKAGVEGVVHVVRAFLEADLRKEGEVASADKGALFTDIKNAYNSADRQTMIDEYYTHHALQATFPLAYWAYKAGTPLLVADAGKVVAIITSAQGGRQGCPLATVLFSLGLHPILVDTLRMVNEGIEIDDPRYIVARAIQDDVTFLGRPDMLVEVWDIFTDTLHDRTPMRCVPSKSFINWPHERKMQRRDQEAFEMRSLGVRRIGKLGGVPLGNPELVQDALLKLAMGSRHDRFWNTVMHNDMPIQEATLLMRASALPRLAHLIRCVPPAQIMAVAKAFDAQLQGAFFAKLGITEEPLSPSHTAVHQPVISQITFAIKMGGGGLRRMTSTTWWAYLASVAASAHDILQTVSGGLLFATNNKAFCNTITTAAVAAAANLSINGYKNDTILAIVPDSAGSNRMQQHTRDFLELHAADGKTGHMQKILTKADENIALNSHVRSLSAADRARFIDLCQPNTSIYLTTMPIANKFVLTDKVIKCAWRTRLGMPPTHDFPAVCRCGKDMTVATGNPHHFLSCIKFRNTTGHIRHDTVNTALLSAMRYGGIPTVGDCMTLDLPCEAKHAEAERAQAPLQKGKTEKRELRTDGMMLPPTPIGPVEWDTTLRSPFTKSGVQQTLKDKGGALAAADSSKKKLYETIVSETRGSRFHALAMSVLGGFSKSAMELLDLVKEALTNHPRPGWDADLAVRDIKASLQVTLMRGNYRMAVNVAQQARVKTISRRGRPLGGRDGTPRKRRRAVGAHTRT
jgi:hypothetical protein